MPMPSAKAVSGKPLAGPASRVASELIPTKLQPPRLRLALVSRDRLIRRVEEGLWRRLTLICAPAGSGKSTLACQWRQKTEVPVAWLSLDEGDNQPLRFLRYLLAAVGRTHSQLARGLQTLSPGAPPELEQALAGLLVIPLADDPRPLVLVLEDYHVIDNPAIHRALAWLVDHLPDEMHLIITTRLELPLALARLRVHDEITELRSQDLRFTLQEVEDFLNRVMALNLTERQVVALEARTEGWAAALQLSALSLADGADFNAFINIPSGDHPLLSEYLVTEVLERQERSIQTFLSLTAPLERLSASLCAALTGEDPVEAAAVLAQLEAANLFLTPLDEGRRWYRYHALFAEVLSRRLERERPGEATSLLTRASRWCHEQGLVDEAFRYALRAADSDWLLELTLSRGDELFARGDFPVLRRCLAALPQASREQHPKLLIMNAWSTLHGGDPEAAEALAEQLEQLQKKQGRGLAGQAAIIRSQLAHRRGDALLGMELARRGLEELPGEAFGERAIQLSQLAIGYTRTGDLARAERSAQQMREAAVQAGSIFLSTISLIIQIWIRLIGLRLTEATALCRTAMREIDEAHCGLLPIAGYPQMMLGCVHFERFELASARAVLEQSLDRMRPLADPFLLQINYLYLARTAQLQQDLDSAEDYLQGAETLAARVNWRDDMGYLSGLRALLALQRKDLDEAEHQLRDFPLEGLDARRPRLYLPRARIRLILTQGRPGPALRVVLPLIDEAEITGTRRIGLECRILKALALQALDRPGEAAAELDGAAAWAWPQGCRRPFAEERLELAPLAPRLRHRELRAFLTETGIGRDGITSPPAGAEELAGLPLEPLSPRELEVLALAARGLSNRDIAVKLCRSVATIKSHLHHIHDKLLARNRTEAIHRARRLGLIDVR